MRRQILALAIITAAFAWTSAAFAQKDDRPNILFIMADDMGYADLGVFGARHIKTPNIDSLAKEGLILTHGYANAPVCSPTRVGLLTGKYQQRFALGLEEPVGPSRPSQPKGLPKELPTIASVLKDRGYKTALVGKWHLGDPPNNGPYEYGYDYFFGIHKGASDYFRHRVVFDQQEEGDGLYVNAKPVERNGYLTRLFADEVINYLTTTDETQPFFISLHFNAPHWPWEGPYDNHVSEGLNAGIQHRDAGTVEKYAEMMESMDANIGRVLEILEDKGIADNTIVVFTSDNGAERFSDTWPLIGLKGELLEGGIRVPIIIRWPGHIEPGSKSEQVMTSMDFAPTFLAAAGGKSDKFDFDGVNLLPQLVGKRTKVERTLFWRFKTFDQAAVRQGDMKYLRINGQEHLFNIAQDPRERAELKDKYPEKFQELKSAYDEWNANMLTYPEDSFSEDVKRNYADRY
ncbi:MAG: sulfatase-like hydrolase/transferase [Parvularculaceae bacterium]